MKLRFYFLFGFFTLLFLFYPGDSELMHTFAFNRRLFNTPETSLQLSLNPLPVVTGVTAPFITAEGVYIADLPSFTPIYSKNARNRFLPASTTKVITAQVAMEVFNPDDIVTVKRVMGEGQIMGLVLNEKITVENLIYGILIHSGNDAAYALADAYGYDNFIARMNAKAKELHMDNTSFRNPAGLDEFDQYSTPYDLALASRALLDNPTLKKTVAIKDITIADVDFNYFHTLSNVNKLLGEVHGIGGLKTGYTENAGENLISFYKFNDHQFIIVLLKSQDRFQDTRNIVDWINKNVTYVPL